ncbi:aspartyl-phosphate phosphatase Spo0E family protein [Cohnella sp. REN36]|uniref:aspartyl-phosphate phosphatase Spo0E family protein n=1 Tax=Cohnella sp. REN36 TaxID=2887347 RepID=UPI001D154FF6|nr:aspartyl-phosphate phosphatase Spo0E family protein [Cohnella sp. REN36]MCC3376700.1 Spo0E family sporulation regulatory protein-aspartic acid phosphatase [Cohnella sp. REN36]
MLLRRRGLTPDVAEWMDGRLDLHEASSPDSRFASLTGRAAPDAPLPRSAGRLWVDRLGRLRSGTGGRAAADKLSELKRAIQAKRQQLNLHADRHGLSDGGCLRYSMELDELINLFYRKRGSAK